MNSTERLDKILSLMGVGSRLEIKRIARLGRISVNGETVKDASRHVNPLEDELRVDGERIIYRKYIYLMMNKPQGVISATEDARDRTVVDLLTPEYRHFELFPVGRLDKDTEGLLLLTNDGKLAHELLSPRRRVPKTYEAIIDRPITDEDIQAFAEGVELDDGYVTMPAELSIHNEVDRAVRVTICEGKYHQIKRMFQAVGKTVVYLKRKSMGPLSLDETLPLGAYRELTKEELLSLDTTVRLGHSIIQ